MPENKEKVKKTGRPSVYSQALADKIMKQISEGASMRKICRQKGMPGLATIWRWMRENENFRDQYAQACKERAHSMHEELIEVSQRSTGDVARDRLIVDTFKWSMSKVVPKQYGDRIQQDHTGSVTVKLGADDDGL